MVSFFLLGVTITGSRSFELFLTLSASESPAIKAALENYSNKKTHTENYAVDPARLASSPAGSGGLEVNGLGRGEVGDLYRGVTSVTLAALPPVLLSFPWHPKEKKDIHRINIDRDVILV